MFRLKVYEELETRPGQRLRIKVEQKGLLYGCDIDCVSYDDETDVACLLALAGYITDFAGRVASGAHLDV